MPGNCTLTVRLGSHSGLQSKPLLEQGDNITGVSRNGPGTADEPPRSGAGQVVVFHHDFTAYNHVTNAVRLLIYRAIHPSGAVNDGVWVENNDVRVTAFLNAAFLFQAQPECRGGAGFENRLLQG